MFPLTTSTLVQWPCRCVDCAVRASCGTHTVLVSAVGFVCVCVGGRQYFAKKDLVNPGARGRAVRGGGRVARARVVARAVVVSPDAGGVYRAKRFREGLVKVLHARARGFACGRPTRAQFVADPGLAMIIKQRPNAGQVRGGARAEGGGGGCGNVRYLRRLSAWTSWGVWRCAAVGRGWRAGVEASQDSDVVIIDDMIDTAGTLCAAAEILKKNGARRVYAFASHGLFSGPASRRIKVRGAPPHDGVPDGGLCLQESCLEEVVVVDTIPLSASSKAVDKIIQVRVGRAWDGVGMCVWVGGGVIDARPPAVRRAAARGDDSTR